MTGKFFLDTNIFVYSFDNSQPEKKACALSLIDKALITGNGVISYQVVQEFMNVALRKFLVPIKPDDCKVYLQQVLMPLCTIFADQLLFESALDILTETKYSFYDALILAGGQRSGAELLYTEDLQHNQTIGNVKIVNPFINI